MVSLSGRAQVPPPPSVRAGLVRSTVVVTLTDETGVRGVLWDADDTGLLLTGAAGEPVQYLAAGSEEWVPVDGGMFVPAAAVKFVQLPEGVQ